MRRPKLRDLSAALLIAALAAAFVNLPLFAGWRAASLDVLFWLRRQSFERFQPTPPSPTVVIALDEETYRREPFENLPYAMWTPQLGGVLRSVMEAGPAAVGVDVIFSTTMERFVPGYERDYLVALRSAARTGKLVLAKVQHDQKPIVPFAGQSVAAGARNIRSVNLAPDADDVIRAVPLFFDAGGGRREPAFAFDIAARAVGSEPQVADSGEVRLGNWTIPGSVTNAMTLKFRSGGDVPTYSFADLHACAEAGKADFFRQAFAGKVVLVGAVLGVEDVKMTSKRLVTAPPGTGAAERCVYPPMKDLLREDFARQEIPGVMIHATAINNLLERRPLRHPPALTVTQIEAGAAFAAVVVGSLLAPVWAAIVLAVAALAWVVAATAAIQAAFVLPLATPLMAMALAFVILLGYRFGVADRDKRLLRASFSLYVAPALVSRLVDAEKPPALGGESREVTVLFSDVAGFTALSETMAPEALVTLMNEYLTAMTECIERHGGMVDKFIGDAIVALFGAPLDDADHATNAVRAALDCGARLAELNGSAAFGGRVLRQRIGLNTGPALVGNVGSRGRFNYTAMGDAVNLAARLEGANKQYGTACMVSESTMAATGQTFVWREIDTLRVVGRQADVRVFEPLALHSAATPAQRSLAERYGAGLAAWRQRDFAAASAAFAEVPDDEPARRLAEAARRLAATPPGTDWSPVNVLDSK